MSGRVERSARQRRVARASTDDDELGAGEVGGRERPRERVRVAIDRDDDAGKDRQLENLRIWVLRNLPRQIPPLKSRARQEALRTAAARPNSTVPTKNSLAASGIDHDGRTAGDATAERTNCEATGVESSESANPTGTTRCGDQRREEQNPIPLPHAAETLQAMCHASIAPFREHFRCATHAIAGIVFTSCEGRG